MLYKEEAYKITLSQYSTGKRSSEVISVQCDVTSVALSALVNANRELIARMEAKIQSVLARIWGE